MENEVNGGDNAIRGDQRKRIAANGTVEQST